MVEATKVTRVDFVVGETADVAIDSISNAVASGAPSIERRLMLQDGTEKEVVVKYKDMRILLRGITMLSANNTIKLGLIRHHKIFGYNKSYRRESNVYQNFASVLLDYLPPYFGTYRRGLQYALILGFIDNNRNEICKNSYKRVLNALTDIQAYYYNKQSCVKDLHLNYYTPRDYHTSKTILLQILHSLDNAEIFTEAQSSELLHFIGDCDKYCNQYQVHRTLTHNDFSYRNIFLTNNRTYFYDWELAAYQNPEHDLVEFLAYHADFYSDAEIENIIKYYYHELQNKVYLKLQDDKLRRALQYNLFEFAVNRLSLLRLASQTIDIPIANKVAKNTSRLMSLIGGPKL